MCACASRRPRAERRVPARPPTRADPKSEAGGWGEGTTRTRERDTTATQQATRKLPATLHDLPDVSANCEPRRDTRNCLPITCNKRDCRPKTLHDLPERTLTGTREQDCLPGTLHDLPDLDSLPHTLHDLPDMSAYTANCGHPRN